MLPHRARQEIPKKCDRQHPPFSYGRLARQTDQADSRRSTARLRLSPACGDAPGRGGAGPSRAPAGARAWPRCSGPPRRAAPCPRSCLWRDQVAARKSSRLEERAMAFDAFVYFDGKSSSGLEVKGETTDDTYKGKGAFEIYSFSLGASNPVTIGSASEGTGGGKVSISSFALMKKTDAASAALFRACCDGSHFGKAHV